MSISDWYWERYWNNKRQKIDEAYPARNGIQLDPRVFYMPYAKVVDLRMYPGYGKDYDKIANDCLTWVRERIRYQAEPGEFWKFAFETLYDGEGDCEDGAILMANMMIASGIPKWRVRINAGDVLNPELLVNPASKKEIGHAYVSYCRVKDNTWYVLDWCYFPELSKDFGLKWNEAEDYFDIWFSFSPDYVFGDKP